MSESGDEKPVADELSPKADEPSPKADEPLPKADEPSPRAVRFANGVLWLVAALCLANLFFAFQLHRKPALKIAAVVGLAAMMAVRLRAKPSLRLSVALMVLPAVFAVGAFELYMGRKRPRDGTAAALRGEPFDSRGLFEVVHDLRKEDPSVQSFAIPRGLLTHNLDAPRWGDEALAHTVRPDWGIEVDGVQTLPFGGVSGKRTVFCNENGYWAIYDADEHGFNNPKGIWGTAPLDVVILGDSYSQGACVPPDKITAAYVRKRFPKTLTLGMCANGPLMELANLKELVVDLKPKIVLWVYFNNDISDMDVEVQSPLLMRYLDEDGFRQNLGAKQAALDKVLDVYLDDVGSRSPAWPSGLASVGLTRASTPLFFQDLVMREEHSSWSGTLRLDWVSSAITSRLLSTDYFAQPPRWDLFRKVLAKAKSTVSGWGGKTYFVYLPDSFFLEFRGKREDPKRAGVLEAAKAAGMSIIDVHEEFLKLPNPESFKSHYVAHYNEKGFALVGNIIVEALARDGN
jgi:hypothetical protein